MDVRSLSVDQLKDLKKQLNKAGRKWFFFREYTTTEGGVSIDAVKLELKRRKAECLKIRPHKLTILKLGDTK